MKKLLNQGFSILEVLLVVFVVIAVIGIGLIAYQRQQDNQAKHTSLDTSSTAKQAATEAPSTIKSKDDLDSADKSLDSNDQSGADQKQLNNQLNY